MSIPTLTPDKANHFVYGAILFLIGFHIHGVIGGWAVCAAAGVLKEIWDIKRGTPDFLDLIATLAGGFVVFGATL